ncbi:MAG: hypothetical protein ACLQU2_09725 [Candidatus Binataceae bacterium]
MSHQGRRRFSAAATALRAAWRYALGRRRNRAVKCGAGFSADALGGVGAGGPYNFVDALFQSGQPLKRRGRRPLLFAGTFDQR